MKVFCKTGEEKGNRIVETDSCYLIMKADVRNHRNHILTAVTLISFFISRTEEGEVED